MAFQEVSFLDADEFAAEGNGLSSVVEGLMYVIDSDDESGLAGLYRGQLGAQVRGLEALLRSADPNMRDTRERLRN
jgi:hypothetical protein